MYHHGVDEQTIKAITGHRSDAVRKYKRPDSHVVANAGRVLAGLPQEPASCESGLTGLQSGPVLQSGPTVPALPNLPPPSDSFYRDALPAQVLRGGGECPTDVVPSAGATAAASRPPVVREVPASLPVEERLPYNSDGSLKRGFGVSDDLMESVPPASRYLLTGPSPAAEVPPRYAIPAGVNMRHGRRMGQPPPVGQPLITSLLGGELPAPPPYSAQALEAEATPVSPIEVLDEDGNVLGHVEGTSSSVVSSKPGSASLETAQPNAGSVVCAALDDAIDRTFDGRQPKRLKLTVDFD